MSFQEGAIFRIKLKGIVALGILASWEISEDTNNGETINYTHTYIHTSYIHTHTYIHTFCGSKGSQELT
jgi:hypothetical protein